MVELRKRPARADPPAAPPAKRSSSKSNTKGPGTSKVKQLATKAKEAVSGKPADDAPEVKPTASGGEAVTEGNTAAVLPETVPATGTTAPISSEGTDSANSGGDAGSKLSKDSVGKTISSLETFGGKVTTHDGRSVTFAELLKEEGAKKGVVVFTYPKASTPGCTTQACLFRDNYTPLTTAGYAVYGLSSDSEKANTGFVTKQKLPFPLLCDPNATLTQAIGMKKPGPGKGTTRGVVVVDKEGTVRVWEQAGPGRTLDVVLEFVKGS